jgi:hypothetical protein
MTGGRQEPFIYGSLGGSTISLVPLPDPPNAAPVPPPAAAAPSPPPVSVPALPKPSVAGVNPTAPAITPPAAKGEPPRPPLGALAAIEPADPCVRDETRLARLRSNPVPDEIVKLQREVACSRLRPQVQRLFESFVSDTPPSPGVDAAPQPAPRQQAQNEPVRADDACARDTARLARLRAEQPTFEAITKFEKELGCEQLRSQLRRLRESVTP